MPMVSIIVPVYNVEPYIHQCVDSILGQTFQDFEVILVNDGSPDNCGNICDEYAKNDDRIHVIHKKNGGLSDARNVGLDWSFKNSESNFLLFVDSDDIIKKNLLEKVIYAQQSRDADIVCFGIEMVDEQLSPLDWGHTKSDREEFFDKAHRFAPLLPPYTTGDYAVNKLYRKSFFKDIRYPKGLTFEDIYTTYKIFDLAENIYLIPDRLYIYRRRNESITRNKAFNPSSFNMFFSAKEKYIYIKERTPDFSKNASAIVFNLISVILSSVFSHKNLPDSCIVTQIRNFVIDSKQELYDNLFCDNYTIKLCRSLIRGLPYAKVYYKKIVFQRKIKNEYYHMLENLILLKHKILDKEK